MSIQLSKHIGYWQVYLEKLENSLGKLGETKHFHEIFGGNDKYHKCTTVFFFHTITKLTHP